MSNRIKELAALVLLVLFLMGLPLYAAAEPTPGGTGAGLNINPLTTAWTAGEWIIDKVTAKPRISLHSAERQAKFNNWMKEDWIKNDPYACLWDPNWIHQTPQPKYKGVCQ